MVEDYRCLNFISHALAVNIASAIRLRVHRPDPIASADSDDGGAINGGHGVSWRS